ncbi:MAG TPA: NADH-quinone oxidoreductase subunit A [Dissulfurispiraceae bacterium]|nr:NADH-quinone oxidoreductase subunit A [Dissulfurispiraceae bacterium]
MNTMVPGNFVPTSYFPILVFMIIAFLFGVVVLLIGQLFRLRRPYPEKLMAYESGNPPFGEARQRFNVRFYIIAMLFVIFDVEAVFLYPWALVYDKIGIYALIEMMLFIAVLVVGYVYAWKKEAFEWD